jgi:phosphoribosylcarboxyaminoimidazole (NCAIR) mutase
VLVLARTGRLSLASPRIVYGWSSLLNASQVIVAIDPLRIVVDTCATGISGHQARQILFHEQRIHTKMSSDSVVVAVIGAGAAPDVPGVLDALPPQQVEGRQVQRAGEGVPATGGTHSRGTEGCSVAEDQLWSSR